MNTPFSSLREVIGDIHWWKQMEDIPVFPVKVYRESEDGTRELIRIER